MSSRPLDEGEEVQEGLEHCPHAGSLLGFPPGAAVDEVGQLLVDPPRGHGGSLFLYGHRHHHGHGDHVVERDPAHCHLVQDHSEAVHIGRELVPLVDHDLGRSPVHSAHIAWCPDQNIINKRMLLYKIM